MIKIDDLWDEVIRFIYDRNAYARELTDFLEQKGVRKENMIIDACAGSGFPSLELLTEGYKVIPLDGTGRMVELFNQNAKQRGLDTRSALMKWEELPHQYTGKARAILCRGNSLIYAGSSWGIDELDIEKAQSAVQQTLRNFYECLEDGGILYVDKFSKDEIAKETRKGAIHVAGNSEQLLWRVEHDLKERTRRWTLIREQSGGQRIEYPNKGYFLMYEELRAILYNVGFRKVEEVQLTSEKNYTVMIAYK